MNLNLQSIYSGLCLCMCAIYITALKPLHSQQSKFCAVAGQNKIRSLSTKTMEMESDLSSETLRPSV